MNEAELEKAMQAVQPPPEAPPPPPPALPLEDALAAAMGRMRRRPDNEIDDAERRERKTIADDTVLARLPRALRSQQAVDRVDRACSPRIAAAARAWRPKKGNLLLLGDSGVGKSTGAACAFWNLVKYGVKAGGRAWELVQRMHWFYAVDLQEARLQHPRGAGDMPPVIYSACYASVLVLDDVGKERFPEAIEEVIANRYDEGLPTIITSNRSYPHGLRELYGEAIVRKMTETLDGRDATIVDITEARK